MNPADAALRLDDVAREIDLIVYRLEQPSAETTDWEKERVKLRRELELMQRRLEDLARELDHH
ncbi:MAG: hypothetical protein AAGA48_35135 [Myxococcota bacterium]